MTPSSYHDHHHHHIVSSCLIVIPSSYHHHTIIIPSSYHHHYHDHDYLSAGTQARAALRFAGICFNLHFRSVIHIQKMVKNKIAGPKLFWNVATYESNF